MKHLLTSIRIMIFFTLLCGLVYPLAMTGFAQAFFSDKANGSFISENGHLIGSELIAQNFEKPEYFWPRPSAVGFNPLPSGGSNLSPTSETLKVLTQERRAKLKDSHNGAEPPQHLVFASASGLDPHLSIEAVFYQIQRVAKARALEPEAIKVLIEGHIQQRQLGLFGEPVVNVLALNLSLDKLQGK